MIPKIQKANCVNDYIVHIVFSDGIEGEVDLKDELYGEIFEPLKEKSYFSKAYVHPDFHTLCWPNGADFAPEYLYEKLHILA